MKFRANLEIPRVAVKQRALLDAFVKDSIEEAARIWVRAAMAEIPVWSGASRATLQPLATAVGEHVAIDVSATAPDRIGLGRLLSRGGIEQRGYAEWIFFYETNLRYLLANETKNVAPRTEGLRGALIHPTPYQFREAGNIAAQAYLASRKPTYLQFESRKING